MKHKIARPLIFSTCLSLLLLMGFANAQDKALERNQPPERADRGRSAEQPETREGSRDRRPEPEQIERRIRELMEAGRNDEAEQLKRQLIQMQHAAGRPGADRSPAREAGELSRHHAEMRDQIGRLHQEGKHAEAERLEQEANKVQARIEQLSGGRGTGDRAREEARGDVDEARVRLQHLRVAVENLHAAGQHDAAESIAQQAQKTEQAIRERDGSGLQSQPDIQQMFRALHEQMEAMHREMGEVQHQLDELRKEKALPQRR